MSKSTHKPFKYALLEWCDTDIDAVELFKTKKALVKYVRENYDVPGAASEFHNGGNYFTDECGFALECTTVNENE